MPSKFEIAEPQHVFSARVIGVDPIARKLVQTAFHFHDVNSFIENLGRLFFLKISLTEINDGIQIKQNFKKDTSTDSSEVLELGHVGRVSKNHLFEEIKNLPDFAKVAFDSVVDALCPDGDDNFYTKTSFSIEISELRDGMKFDSQAFWNISKILYKQHGISWSGFSKFEQ